MLKFINLTSHTIKLNNNLIPPSSKLVRCVEENKLINFQDEVPFYETHFSHIIGLPEPKLDTIYIVSSVVITALKDQNISRPDVFAPKDFIRSPEGIILGCMSLGR